MIIIKWALVALFVLGLLLQPKSIKDSIKGSPPKEPVSAAANAFIVACIQVVILYYLLNT